MIIVGWLLILWGILDFALYFMDMDIYYELGINLPDIIWQFSAWISIGLGAYIVSSNTPEDDIEIEYDDKDS